MNRQTSFRWVNTFLILIWIVVMHIFQLNAQEEPFHEYIRPFEMLNIETRALNAAPVYASPGEKVDVTLELFNNSNQSVENLNVVLFAGRKLVDSQQCTIAAMEAATVRFALQAPQGEQHTILTAEVDPDFTLMEQTRLDNVISTEVFVTKFIPGADFAVSQLEVITTGEGPDMLQAAVYNNGSIAAGTVLTFSVGNKIISTQLTGLIEPRSSVILQAPLTVPVYSGLITAEVNPRYRWQESNPEDNRTSLELRPPVDIRVENLSVQAAKFQHEPNRQVTISFRVVNGGQEAVERPFRTSIFPGIIDPDGSRPVYITTDRLAPGEAEYISHTIEFAPGEFDIRIEADADRTIDEDNEENNFASYHYQNPTPNVGRWVSIGPRLIKNGGLGSTGRLYQIAIPKTDPSTIYVGAATGSAAYKGGCGVWKTTNGGTSWKPITDALESLCIAAIAIDPSKSSRVYVATHNTGTHGNKIYRSDNSGKRRKNIYSGTLQLRGNSIFLIDPTDTQRMFLGSARGVYRSTNGGTGWELVQEGLVDDLIMDPSNPKKLYVAIEASKPSNYNKAGVYETTAGGDKGSWHKLTGCPKGKFPVFNARGIIRLALSGNTLYASTMINNIFTVYRTINSECTTIGQRKERAWEKRWSSNISLSNLYADPKDPTYVYASFAGGHFWTSTDSGKTFTQVGGKAPHADHHGFATDPQNPKIIYTLTDGGIYQSSDHGKDGTWKFIGEGIENVEIYDLAIAKSDPNLVIAGTQDNGNIIYKGSTTWKEIPGAEGDGWSVAIDPTNTKKFYTMHQWSATLRRHSNGIAKCIACGLPPNIYYTIFHCFIHPNNTTKLIAWCANELYSADDPECTDCPKPPDGSHKNGVPGKPVQWKKIWTVPAGKGNISAATIDPTIDLYYTGTSRGDIYAAPNGANWKLIFSDNTFTALVTDIEIDPNNPKTVYVAFNTTRAHRVHKLVRSSTTPDIKTISSQDITFNLPADLIVYTIAVHPKKANTIFAGTNKGVYQGRSFDSGKTWKWSFYNNGMPQAVHISDLEIHPSNGLMRAATKGRGVYAVYTYSAEVLVEITPGQKEISPGGSGTYNVRVLNRGVKKDTWQLSLKGLEKDWVNFSQSYFTLNPGQESKVTLTVTLPQCAAETTKTFTVTATSATDPTIYGLDQALLIIKVPDRPLAADLNEDNNTIQKATPVKLGSTKTVISSTLKNLTLHSSTDVDYFKIEFTSDPKAECIGGSTTYAPGSFLSAFAPQYYPGSLSIHAKEEFCRKMNVEISYAKPNSNYLITQKYRTANAIIIECPTGKVDANTVYVAVRREEKDKVRYELEISYSGWMITLKKPLVDIGPLRYPRPPYLRIFDPRIKYYNYRDFLADFEREYPQYLNYLERFRAGNGLLLQGQVAGMSGHLDEAEGLLRESLATFTELGDQSAQADVLRNLGVLYTVSGRLEEAQESLMQASELHAASGNMSAYALDQVRLGELYLQRGNPGEALKICDEAFRLQVESSDHIGQFQNLMVQFEAFLSLENPKAALASLILLEEIAKMIDDPDLQTQLDTRVFMARERLGESEYNRLKSLLQDHPRAAHDAVMLRIRNP